MTETAVNSFVVRFTQEQNGAAPWHGTIRHVQSDTESRFSHMAEAVSFMTNFVESGDWQLEMNDTQSPIPNQLP